jgi:site-specific DNA-methyltransferase (adenine-specific)/adenine-specific DNA-methyltransferase
MTKLSKKDRQRIIEILESEEELPLDYKHILFPPERKEYELVYASKEREEDILADNMAVPLQAIKTFGKNGNGWTNKLIFGDNLQTMKSLLDDPEVKGRVKLIYIDPPFATKQEFRGSQDQKAYQDKIAGAKFVEFLRKRLIFLRELLADDGSIYVHLDWKKVHYVKAIMDEIFKENNFLNEVVWYYRRWNIATNLFARNHDTLLYYAKKYGSHIFNNLYIPKSPKSSGNGKAWQSVIGEDGVRRSVLLDKESKGVPMPDMWEISMINPVGLERKLVEYPTQKPEELLERIINASTNSGDIVLDAFAGSGTTCAVAEKLGRRQRN